MNVTTQQALNAHNDLTWVHNHWHHLRNRLTPTHNPDTSGGAKTTTTPIPIDVHVSTLLAWLDTQTRRFGGLLLNETTDWSPRTSTMPGLLYCVNERYGHFTAHEDPLVAYGYLGFAKEARTRVLRALEKPEPPKYIGPCPHHGCHGELYARTFETNIECPDCHQTTTLEEELAYLYQQLEQRLMTTGEIVSALIILNLPVPRSTILRWASNGKLAPVTDNLYRLADALDLATARRTR